MWVAYLAPRLCEAALAGLLFWLLAPAARADETRVSISGFDPVAYFTDGKPVPGSSEFEYVWHDARWRFASATHRDLFAKDPEHYAPQYDGYCAMGVADAAVFGPHKDTVDPEAWAIVDGKLYLTHTRHTMDRWRPNLAENIKRADANWSAVAYQPEPTIIGPPCAAISGSTACRNSPSARCVPASSAPISRLKPTTSACKMAASFLFREADSPGGSGGLSRTARIADAFDLAAWDPHYRLSSNHPATVHSPRRARCG